MGDGLKLTLCFLCPSPAHRMASQVPGLHPWLGSLGRTVLQNLQIDALPSNLSLPPVLQPGDCSKGHTDPVLPAQSRQLGSQWHFKLTDKMLGDMY